MANICSYEFIVFSEEKVAKKLVDFLEVRTFGNVMEKAKNRLVETMIINGSGKWSIKYILEDGYEEFFELLKETKINFVASSDCMEDNFVERLFVVDGEIVTYRMEYSDGTIRDVILEDSKMIEEKINDFIKRNLEEI